MRSATSRGQATPPSPDSSFTPTHGLAKEFAWSTGGTPAAQGVGVAEGLSRPTWVDDAGRTSSRLPGESSSGDSCVSESDGERGGADDLTRKRMVKQRLPQRDLRKNWLTETDQGSDDNWEPSQPQDDSQASS